MSIHSLPVSTPARDGFSSMGIAVDNLSMSEAVDRISALIAGYERDQRARFVATLNVDFIVNSLGYFFSCPSHPELLEILRSADLVTADGFPVVLLSKIMGKPIKERVTGADLVPALATRAARDGLSMYLLGGKSGSAKQAAARLIRDNPSLLIAGTDAPMVHVDGDALGDYERDDSAIVERINASGANILLIGFGNPKQEQWFYRNRSKLRVGVAIGVGGTFEFLAGSVKRAPAVFQRLNIEWLYRISQDPGRLWRRYAKGIFKFGLLTLPILLIRASELLQAFRRQPDYSPHWNTLWGSRQDVIETVQLPRYVNGTILQQLTQTIRDKTGSQRMLIVDMSRVKHIELAAYLPFFELGNLFKQGTVNGLLLNIKPAVRRRLEAGRIMDACQRHTTSFKALRMPGADAASTSTGMNCRSYVLEDAALIYLSGRVDGNALARLGFDICVADMSRNRTCVIDLRDADLLESTAVAHFYRIVQALPDSAHKIYFSGVGAQARRVFELAGVTKSLDLITDERLRTFIFSQQQAI
jgi:N-acetylglucosaminyldiphosphoundecaprenol N-acetyl-beta-D-mannosaminyltransferase